MKRTIAAILALACMPFACAESYEIKSVSNMLDTAAADPYVVEHENGYYYCWSDGTCVYVKDIANLNKIRRTSCKPAWFDHDFMNVWAPELHRIDGTWYIYVAACRGGNENELHRMYCLKALTDDPTQGFELVGEVTDPTDKWAIDGTVFTYDEKLYTVWSGWPGDTDVTQHLYIAEMSDPWTIISDRVEISVPDSWDAITQSPSVNEGPCAVEHDGKLYILYSGNGSWTDDYCIGVLSLTGDDPMDASAWTKGDAPILSKAPAFYGPGHCSVANDITGEPWIIYHANKISGSGWNGRSVRLQRLQFNENGPYVEAQLERVDLPILP